jgi:hypothetical protein
MEQTEVESAVCDFLHPMQIALDLGHVDFTIKYETLTGTDACINRDIKYDMATIRIDPAQMVDRDYIALVLRHELLHYLHGAFDVYIGAVHEYFSGKPKMQMMLETLRHYAAEQTNLALQRAFNKTGIKPMRLVAIGKRIAEKHKNGHQ